MGRALGHAGVLGGRSPDVRLNRYPLVLLGAGLCVLLFAASSIRSGPGGEGQSLFDVTSGPHVAVSALPGVDLDPVTSLAGSSSSSGPFPGVKTSARYGGKEITLYVEARPMQRSVVDSPAILAGRWVLPQSLVLERSAARRLRATPGERVHLTTASGKLPLVVAGVAETTARTRYPGSTQSVGYVLHATLADIAPNKRLHNKTLFIRLEDPSASGAVANSIRAAYPGLQAAVEDWKSPARRSRPQR